MSWSALGLAIACASLPAEVNAQAVEPQVQISLSSRTLRRAIAELAREAHVSIGTEGTLPSLRTPELHGSMSVSAALSRLLAGSRFSARRVGRTAWLIARTVPQPSASAAPAPALASPAPLPVSEPGPPIIVTAPKTTRDLFGLPIAMALIDLRDEPASLPDAGSAWAAAQVEGLALTASGAGRNRMFLRGVADSPLNGESQSTVAILLNSARVTYAAPDPDIRLVDIDRVEVLKGPQGSLYGAGTLGGIYQVHTRQPQQNDASLILSGGINAVSGGDLGYGGTAVANLPLVDDRLALRVVAYGTREAGWVDTGNRDDSNSLSVLGSRAALAFEPDGGWRFDLSGLVQHTNSADSQYVYAEGARRRPAQLPEPHDNDIALASAHATGPVGVLQLTLDTSHVWHEVRDTFDATIGAGAFGVTDPLLLHDDRAYRIWNAEVRLEGELGRIDWLLGLARIEARQQVLAVLETASAPAAAVLDDDRRLSAENALFGNARMPLGRDFSLELGARLFAGMVKDTRLVGGQPITRDLHRTGVTPSGSLSWQPETGRLVYLRYGSALRQGGVDIGSNGELEEFDSDKLATLELGWREQLAVSGRLDLGLFATRWSDMQSDVLLASGLIETTNVGNGRILGMEATWDQDLGANWHLAAGGTLVNATLVRNTSGQELDDRRLPVVPTYTLRAGATHGFVLGAVSASAGLQVNYNGPARLSFDPLLDRKMGSVLTATAHASAEVDDWQVGLVIENLFGGRSDTFAFGNRLRILTMNQFTPLRPTTVTLSLAQQF